MTQSFVAAQTYPGATPQLGFLAPMLYQLGNGGHADSYYRDIVCGNTANPTAGPDGDAATRGWDAATGWGEPDWFNFATGVALSLGATNLSVPASRRPALRLDLREDAEQLDRACVLLPDDDDVLHGRHAPPAQPRGTASSWPAAPGARSTRSSRAPTAARRWFPSNSDMFSIACTSASTCIEVGAGGRERRTTRRRHDAGRDVATAAGNNKPLTQVTCPSASTCYAVGDRGNAMKSSDGGQTWSWLNTTDGNPLYGLSCPTRVHLLRDGHLRPRRQDGRRRRVLDVAADPDHDAGHRRAGLRRSEPVRGPDGDLVLRRLARASPPAFTSCRAARRSRAPTRRSSRRPTAARTGCARRATPAPATTCTHLVPARHDDLHGRRPWRQDRHHDRPRRPGRRDVGTTSMLNSVTCLSTSFCMAVGQNGTVDIFNGATWTATTGNGGTGMLASVACLDAAVLRDRQAGRDHRHHERRRPLDAAGRRRHDAADERRSPARARARCYAPATPARSWRPRTAARPGCRRRAGRPATSTASPASRRARLRRPSARRGTARFTTDGSTWNAGTTGTTQRAERRRRALGDSLRRGRRAPGRSSPPPTAARPGRRRTSGDDGRPERGRLPVGGAATRRAPASGGAVMLKSTDGGSTWAAQTSGTAHGAERHRLRQRLDLLRRRRGRHHLVDQRRRRDLAAAGQPAQRPDDGAQRNEPSRQRRGLHAARCIVGAGSQGDIVHTPLLTVTVNASSVYGTTPQPERAGREQRGDLLLARRRRLRTSPAALTCSTTADRRERRRHVPGQLRAAASPTTASASSTTTPAPRT